MGRVIDHASLLLVFTLLSAVAFLAPAAFADTCTWNGSNGSWHTGGSWSCGHEPGAGDTAVINSGTVTVTSNVTVDGLTQGGGTVDGAGDISISVALVWTNGTHGGTGETTLGAAATWVISGNTKNLDRNFRNEGAITWTGSTVNVPTGVTFTNAGSIDIQGNNVWGTNGSGAILDNQGTITKTAGTGITYVDSVLQNSGSVDVSSGTLQIRVNSTTTGSFTSTGPGLVDFNTGNHDLQASSTVTGQNVRFYASGTATVSGTFTPVNTTINKTVNFNNGARTLQNLTFQGSTLGGDSDLTISSLFNWTGGTIQRSALTTLGSGATWEISGGTKNLNSDFRNEGAITWTGSTVNVPTGVTFTNAGSIDIQGNNVWGTNGSGAILDNQGTITKTAGTGITYVDSVLQNSGSVDVSSGTLQIRVNSTTTGSFTSTGPGLVDFNTGNHDLQASSTVIGQNVRFYASGTATVSGTFTPVNTTINKTVNFNNGARTLQNLTFQGSTLGGDSDLTISSLFNWTGGTIQRSALTTLGSGATWEISGGTKNLNSDFRNEGAITWTGSTVNVPTGVTFTNAGSIDIQGNNVWGTNGSGAILDNQGTITKTAGTGITYMDSVLQNSGSVDVSSGTLQIRVNSTTTGSFTSTGPGLVDFNTGNHDLQASSTVTGQNVRFYASGTATVSGTFTPVNTTINKTVNFNNGARTLQNLTFQGSTLGGDSDLTISSLFNWTGGTIQRSALTTLGSGATWEISGGTKNLNSDFRNEGAITWTGSTVNVPTGVTFTNAGSIDIQGNNVWGTNGSGAILDNQGTITKTAGTGITYMDSVLQNSGSVDVSSGTLQIRVNSTTTGSFTSTGPGLVDFNTGNHDLQASSTVTGQNVRFYASGTADVNGTYSVAHTTINKVVNLMPIAGTIGSISLQGGTLNPLPVLEMHGDFIRTGGTYNHAGNTLAFVGGTTQNFSLSSLTAFNNIEVIPGTLLVETVHADNCETDGWLLNDGVIRKTKTISGGNVTFGLTKVEMNVVNPGDLTEIQIDWTDCDHADAFGEAWTASSWEVTPNGSNYEVDVILPHGIAPDTNAQVCFDVLGVDDWNCDRSSSTADTVILEGVTSLADMAAGDSRLAGAIFPDGFEYRCARWSRWFNGDLPTALETRSGGPGCGGWIQTRVLPTGVDPDPDGRGRISGTVTDAWTGMGAVNVELHFFRDEIRLATALTDEFGEYSSPPLAEGTYVVATHGQDLYLHELWRDLQCVSNPRLVEGQSVTVVADVETRAIDFALDLGVRISGTAVSSITGEGVERTRVRICTGTGEHVIDVLTDELGRYETPALLDGTYQVTPIPRTARFAAGESPCDQEGAIAIQLLPGDCVSEVDLMVD